MNAKHLVSAAARGVSGLLCVSTVVAGAAHAQDTVPFVVVTDTGTVQSTPFDTFDHADLITNAILDLYRGTGAELPEVMSVWTAFPFDNNTIETRFVPLGNDITGIGLENAFGAGQEVFQTQPPLRAMLIHNDVTDLAHRAEVQGFTAGAVPDESFAQYLFLLELGHLFGPEIHVPGAPANRLIGFDFHWSFFADAGGSPIGGNAWTDNGDGTFTAPVFEPGAATYSDLDLYLMGLAPASQVAPFGLLHDVVFPDGVTDPFSGRGLSAASFPWAGPAPLVVTAQREVFTIDDVIAQNGARAPAFGEAPTSFTLGVVLVVSADLVGEPLAAVERGFAPVAAGLAPAFARATGQRGSLAVVTSSAAPPVPPGPPGPPAVGDPEDTGPQSAGCAATDASGAGVAAALWLLVSPAIRRAWRRARSC